MLHFRTRLSESQQLLCDAIQAGDPGRARDAVQSLRRLLGEDEAFSFADRHEVASILGHQLLGSTAVTDRPWISAHEKVMRTMTDYMRELDEIADQFANEGIDLIALKNGGIARGLYPCWGCCPMGDLDLLVRPSRFRQAHKILIARGYQFEFRFEGLAADLEKGVLSGSTEYYRYLDGDEPSPSQKLWIDFQSRPVSGLWIRPDQEPSADMLIDRSMPIAGSLVRLLAPEDNLLQVALHTAKHSYLRAPGLRLHTDVDRVVAAQDVDWDDFQRRVREYTVRLPVYFSLTLAHELFQTPIPEEVLRNLRPPNWKETWIRRWIERAGLFEPQQRKFGRLGYMVFTSLQYDNLGGIWRAVFPDPAWIRGQFVDEPAPLPVLYLRRLRRLIFRRITT